MQRMGNVLRILKRDLLRLLKAPAALIVVGALLLLPSLYTWYNVVAFWNPYEATGNLTVCVVNNDAGVENKLTGALNVGDRVTEELLANDKLNFIAKDSSTAMSDLESGAVYAVYVIPEDFSECLISPVTGKVKSPHIKYYVNEKLGPVSPKITDTAANTLDQTINSMFVTTVSETAVKAVNEAVDDAEADVAEGRSKATARMNEAVKAIEDVRKDLADIKKATANAKDKAESASSAMDDASKLTTDAQTVVDDISDEVDAVQDSLLKAASGSVGSLSDIIVDVSQVTAKASTVADGFVTKAGAAQSRIDLVTGRVQPVVDAMTDISEDLQKVADALPSDSSAKATIAEAAQNMSSRSSQLQTIVDDAKTLSSRIGEIAQGTSDSVSDLGELAEKTSASLEKYSKSLYGDAAPTINSSLAQISVTCEKLSAATSNLNTTIKQAKASLAQLEDLLGDCTDAINQTDKLVEEFQDDIKSISTDVNLLAKSGVIANIVKNGTLNSESISKFLGSPTELKTEKFYTPNAYGTAMAPLFMNLTFWIGAFMLVIIFLLGVDDKGIRRITPGQRYLSRFLLFSGIAVGQALICCAGVLFLGVEVANIPAFFLAAAVASLAYLSVIYALSSTLQHIGKALCIILVFAQIPGGSGLYPLELTDSFFRAIHPLLPFSYGIGALREAICGFYGNYYVQNLAILALIFVTALILGMVLTPLMSNVIRMAARQIREGDLYNGEDAVVPERPYRISQVIYALTDREDYRDKLEKRYARFNKMYPIFIRASIVLGAVVPVVLMLLLALDAGEKVILITAILLWFVAMVVFLVVVESLRYSFERQMNIDHMSDENLLKLFFSRDRMHHAGSKDNAAEGADNA